MRHLKFVAGFALLAACASDGSKVESAGGDVEPDYGIVLDAGYIPSGVQVGAHFDRELSTRSNGVGDRFTALVDLDVLASSGAKAIPRDTRIWGHVTAVRPPTATMPGAITLEPSEIELRGRVLPFRGEILELRLPETGQPAERPAVTLTPVSSTATRVEIGGVRGESVIPRGAVVRVRLTQGIIVSR